MMIHSFEYYIKLGKAKKKTPDKEEANSLLDKSQKRLNYLKRNIIDENSSAFILEDAYESIRESTQSLMSIKGYKPYSHEATISFIKEFYNNLFTEEDIHLFDRYRELRNNSIYKAMPISKKDAKDCLQFSQLFIKKIKSLSKE